MSRALSEYRVSGPKTNLYFHRRAILIDDFVKGTYDTSFIEKHLKKILELPSDEKIKALMAGALAKYLEEKKPTVSGKVAMMEEVSTWRRLGRLDSLRK